MPIEVETTVAAAAVAAADRVVPEAARRRGSGAKEPTSRRDWALIWFGKLARFHRIDDPQSWQFSRDDVIGLLQSEKARGGA